MESMDGSPEQQGGVESSVSRVKNQVVESLQKGPNLTAELNPTSGEIQISPQYLINNNEIGAFQKEGQDYKKVGESPVGSENEIGQQTVSKVCGILREEIGGDNYFGILITGGEFLGDVEYSHSAVDQIRQQIYRQDRLAKLLGFHWRKRAEQSPYNSLPGVGIAGTKGIPPEIAEAIIYGTTSWLARKTNEAATQEAVHIDDKHVTVRKPALQERITTLKDTGIPTSQEKKAQLGRDSRLATESHEEAQKRVQNLDRYTREIGTFLRNYCGKVPKNKLEVFQGQMPQLVKLLKEEGSFFNKKVTGEDTFEGFDNALSSLLVESGIPPEYLSALGFDNGAQLLIRTAQRNILNNYNLTDPIALFDESQKLLVDSDLLSGINATNSSGQRTTLVNEAKKTFEQQRSYLAKLSKQNPDAAKQFARNFFARAVCFHVVNRGFEQTRETSFTGGNLSRFLSTSHLGSYLSESDNYKGAKEAVTQGERSKNLAENQLREQGWNISRLEKELEEATGELKRMDGLRDIRLKKIKAQIIAKILVDNRGKQPNVNELETFYETKSSQWNYFIQSKLLADTVETIFAGMPHFVANDSRHPGAGEQAAKMRFQGYAREEAVKQLHDFMPDVVSSLIPQDHPTREKALEFICDMMRRYPSDPGVLGFSGFGYGTDTEAQAAKRMRSIPLDLIAKVASGNKVLLIPQEIQTADLDLLIKTQWQGEQATKVLKGSFSTLRKYVQSLGLSDYELVSLHKLTHPDTNNRHTKPVTKKEFDNVNSSNSASDIFQQLVLFKKSKSNPYGGLPVLIIGK